MLEKSEWNCKTIVGFLCGSWKNTPMNKIDKDLTCKEVLGCISYSGFFVSTRSYRVIKPVREA